jgi:hypothetical protein
MRGAQLALRPAPLLAKLVLPLNSRGRIAAFAPRCEARSAKGKQIKSDAILSVGSSVGEGSFGQVFQVSISYYQNKELGCIATTLNLHFFTPANEIV